MQVVFVHNAHTGMPKLFGEVNIEKLSFNMTKTNLQSDRKKMKHTFKDKGTCNAKQMQTCFVMQI